jgi:hypothetical protein
MAETILGETTAVQAEILPAAEEIAGDLLAVPPAEAAAAAAKEHLTNKDWQRPASSKREAPAFIIFKIY